MKNSQPFVQNVKIKDEKKGIDATAKVRGQRNNSQCPKTNDLKAVCNTEGDNLSTLSQSPPLINDASQDQSIFKPKSHID